VSQTAGTRPGNRYYDFLPEIQPGCLFPPEQPPGPAGLLPLIFTDGTDSED
jgi:hypothetical protein